ncbi:MAG: hypothetical protein ISS36_02470 [Candidatus Aenigmarchaeota archaeon]|nr:hypothetical protein [Candidatus Aenigmarchaeota archaeon]
MCKGGRALCGNNPCPLIPRFKMAPEIKKKISEDFFGPSYNLFVGRFGYPNVSLGPMAAIEERPNMDNPEKWLGLKYSEIIEIRSLLLRSRRQENVKSDSRYILEAQELALASKPTDIEVLFKNKPSYNVSFSDVTQPMGPSGTLKKLRIAENPKIPQKLEKIVSDDLKANEAANILYQKGTDVYKLSTILSSGVLGLEKNKKIVPTHWSITGIDDLIAKDLMKKIREYPSINNYIVFESKYLDNHFVILMMPGNWEFENFEAWAPGSMWSRGLKKMEIVEEYEPFKGKTKYADQEGGGYYASRIACVEKLSKMKRQARVIVFREIYEGYNISLGVWVVRQTARSAYKKKKEFSTLKEAMDYADSKLRISMNEYVSRSKLLKQRRLGDFF